MCDTDSVITDAKLNDYPDLMEEFMWDGCGDALGSLKNEADDHLKDCGWCKDDMKRLKEEEGGMLHFDALILGGCKFYCLRKEGCEEIAKLKGFKKSKGEELSERRLRDDGSWRRKNAEAGSISLPQNEPPICG